MAGQPIVLILCTFGKTPSKGDQPDEGRYLHTGQHRINTHTHTDIHASTGIRTYDLSVWAGEESSCIRARGYCDRLSEPLVQSNCESGEPPRISDTQPQAVALLIWVWTVPARISVMISAQLTEAIYSISCSPSRIAAETAPWNIGRLSANISIIAKHFVVISAATMNGA
jgi:hypothetical protein